MPVIAANLHQPQAARTRRRLHPACIGKVLFAFVFWFFPASQARAGIEHVLLISFDGLRGDFVEEVMRTAPEELPNFIRLRDAGASTCNARCDHAVSLTIPNHLCMITGRPAYIVLGQPNTVYHGYLDNDGTGSNIHTDGNPAVPYKASIFDVVHDAGLSTAEYLSKSRLNILIRSYDEAHGAPDTTGADDGQNKVDVAGYYIDGVPLVNTAASLVTAIQDGNFKNFTMLHITETDYAGHDFGWYVAPGTPYRLAMQRQDTQLGTILDAVESNPLYAGHTAIIVTADHGGGGPSNLRHHEDPNAIENVTIPFFVKAPGLPGGVDLYDWLENRFNPGTTLPDYTVAAQPLRNGDAGNLAAALLGLPPIPGSFMRPMLKRPVKVEFNPATGAEVSWPLYLTGHKLEVSDELTDWRPITTGITETATRCHYLDALPLPTGRYYRLRAP